MMQGSFAEKLRVLRARRGMPLTIAAETIGVDRHTLRNLELGESTPRYPTLLKIAEAYGMPVEELLEEPVPLAEAPEAGPLHHVRRPHDSIEVSDAVKVRLKEQFDALIHELETLRRSTQAAELERLRDEVIADEAS